MTISVESDKLFRNQMVEALMSDSFQKSSFVVYLHTALVPPFCDDF